MFCGSPLCYLRAYFPVRLAFQLLLNTPQFSLFFYKQKKSYSLIHYVKYDRKATTEIVSNLTGPSQEIVAARNSL